MRQLLPPLNVIEAGLFEPSPELIQRWALDGADLPPASRAALDANPDAHAMADVLRRPPDDDAFGDLPDQGAVVLPAHLAAMIDARARLSALQLDARPRPGLMLRVDQATAPSGPTGWDMAQPLAVLLSEPTEHPDVWYGWLLASDTDYACTWDLLLEDDDGPVDPMAAMVQAWNPVHLYVPSAAAVLGELSAQRLAAVRDLALELLEADDDAAAADPGTLVQRVTQDGHLVLTGTPLGAADDPRWRYQELYFAAADLLRDLARQAIIERSPRTSWWQQVLEALRAAADGWQLPLEPVPVLSLGTEDNAGDLANHWHLGDWLDMSLIPSSTGDAIQIHLASRTAAVLSVALSADGVELQSARLDGAAAQADLFAGMGEALTFSVRDAEGKLLFEAALAKPENLNAET